MANTVIQIKRGQSAAAPSSLANGEIAYSFSSNKMFIGQTTTAGSPVTVEYIGGKLVVDKVANLESVLFGGDPSVSNLVITNTLTLSGYTTNGVLITKAGGKTEAITGAVGKVMQIASNNTPVFDDMDGGTY
jgi:hypothetical protein